MKSVEFNRHIFMKLADFPVTILWALVSRKRRHLHILKKRKHWENKQTVTLIFVSCLPWTRFCRSESSSFSFYSHFLEDKGSYSGKIISPNASETNIPTMATKGDGVLHHWWCLLLSSAFRPMQVSALITSTYSENILSRLLRKVAILFLCWRLRIPFWLSVITHHYQPLVEEMVEFRMQLEEVVWIIDT